MANIGQNFDKREMIELLKRNGNVSVPQQEQKTENTDSSLFTNKATFGSLTKSGTAASGLEAGLQTKTSSPAKEDAAKETQEAQGTQGTNSDGSIFGGSTNVSGGSVDSIFANTATKPKSTDDVLGESDWGGVGLSFSGSSAQQTQDTAGAQDTSLIGKVKNLFSGINNTDTAQQAQQKQVQGQ